MILRKVNDSVLDIITYFPYTSSDYSLKPVLLSTCRLGVLEKNDVFPNKLPKVWTNTTLRVAPMFYPPYVICFDGSGNKGIESKMARMTKLTEICKVT